MNGISRGTFPETGKENRGPDRKRSRDRVKPCIFGVGVFATLSTASERKLLRAVEPSLSDLALAYNLDEIEPRTPRITIVPPVEVAKLMTLLMQRKANKNFGRVKEDLVYSLGKFSNLNAKLEIEGFNWYGTKENALAATLVDHGEGYENLLKIQSDAVEVLGRFGIIAPDLLDPNHITLCRVDGVADESVKDNIAEGLNAQFRGGSITSRGLIVRTVEQVDTPIGAAKSPFRPDLKVASEIG